jgi:hypothetical protein
MPIQSEAEKAFVQDIIGSFSETEPEGLDPEGKLLGANQWKMQ